MEYSRYGQVFNSGKVMDAINRERSEVFQALHEKFGKNITLAVTSDSACHAEAEMGARLVIRVADSLRGHANSTTRQDLLSLFDEIFSDLICSLYLSSAALDVPAKMLLRRALELSVALLYLWDIPHLYWAWKDLDADLNFREMTTILSGDQYDAFVRKENPDYQAGPVLEANRCNRLYRKLSNVSHGKAVSFESYDPDRFTYSESQWVEHSGDVKEVTDIVISAWKKRYREVSQLLVTDRTGVR